MKITTPNPIGSIIGLKKLNPQTDDLLTRLSNSGTTNNFARSNYHELSNQILASLDNDKAQLSEVQKWIKGIFTANAGLIIVFVAATAQWISDLSQSLNPASAFWKWTIIGVVAVGVVVAGLLVRGLFVARKEQASRDFLKEVVSKHRTLMDEKTLLGLH